jgi:hypothetical protein
MLLTGADGMMGARLKNGRKRTPQDTAAAMSFRVCGGVLMQGGHSGTTSKRRCSDLFINKIERVLIGLIDSASTKRRTSYVSDAA